VGDGTNPRAIILNEFGVSVSENLKAALQEMSTHGNTFRIWVDALCINQMISTGVRVRSISWKMFIGVSQK
jgi:hypothetical protein